MNVRTDAAGSKICLILTMVIVVSCSWKKLLKCGYRIRRCRRLDVNFGGIIFRNAKCEPEIQSTSLGVHTCLLMADPGKFFSYVSYVSNARKILTPYFTSIQANKNLRAK